MFCSNCGCELSEEVRFCSKCGKAIITTEVAAVKEEEFEKNAPVSAEFENVTVQNQFSERVNSELFADRRSQNKLFSLYADLINPVKKIEELTEKINECGSQIKYLRNEKNAEIEHGRISIVLGILLGMPLGFLIVAFITEGELNFFSFIMGYIVMPAVLTVVFRKIWKGTYGKYYKNREYKKNLSKADKFESMQSDLLKERDEVCFSIKDKLMYVPKKYRYSEALAYFVDLYNSTRVDTLKEAVNVYAHDKQEEEKIQILTEKINEVIVYLASIGERV